MNRKFTLLVFAACIPFLGAQAQYCASGATSTADSKCDNVVLNGNTVNISNNTSASGCVTYTDFTALSAADLTATFSYSIDITIGTCNGSYNRYINAWIDFNGNNTFEASEALGGATGVGPFGTSGTVVTFNFSVPAGATPGNTRMRVIVKESGSASDPCASFSWGETEDYTVDILPPPLSLVAVDTINLNCFGDVTDISTETFGGTTPYTYLWNTASVNDTIFGVSGGSYSCIVTDNNGDMDTAYIEVVEPTAIATTTSVVQDIFCDYDSLNGIGEVTASGGTPTEGAYLHSLLNSADTLPKSGDTLLSLGDDDWELIPIGFDFDFFGTTYNELYVVSNGYLTLGASTTSLANQTFPNTTAPNNIIALAWDDLNPTSGGTIGYKTIGTTPDRILQVTFTEVPHYASAGTTVTGQILLYEASNCIDILSVDIQDDGGTLTQGIENSTGTYAITYPGRNNTVWNTTNDGISFCPDTTGLTYLWDNGTSFPINEGITSGVHYVTVTDAAGCEAIDSVEITEPVSYLVSDLELTDVSCFSLADGTIDPGITGGSGTMTYTWSNAASGNPATLSDLGPGMYSVYAEDNKGCTIEVNNISIWEPTLLIAAITGVEGVVCPGDTTGSAMGVASGGVEPYTYVWAPLGATGQSVSSIPDGNYNLVVTDANGCESYTSVSVLASSSTPIVDLGDDIYDTGGGTHILNAGSHTGYSWTGGSAGSTLEVTATGTYKVTVTNAEGCEGYDEVYVEIWPTGINSLSEGNLKVYPNPATSVINLEFSNDLVNATLNIVDAKGAIISSSTLGNSGLATVNVESIPSGVYTLSVVSGSRVSTHKLVISK